MRPLIHFLISLFYLFAATALLPLSGATNNLYNLQRSPQDMSGTVGDGTGGTGLGNPVDQPVGVQPSPQFIDPATNSAIVQAQTPPGAATQTPVAPVVPAPTFTPLAGSVPPVSQPLSVSPVATISQIIQAESSGVTTPLSSPSQSLSESSSLPSSTNTASATSQASETPSGEASGGHGVSGGVIAAAVIVPLLVIGGLIAAWLVWRRRQQPTYDRERLASFDGEWEGAWRSGGGNEGPMVAQAQPLVRVSQATDNEPRYSDYEREGIPNRTLSSCSSQGRSPPSDDHPSSAPRLLSPIMERGSSPFSPPHSNNELPLSPTEEPCRCKMCHRQVERDMLVPAPAEPPMSIHAVGVPFASKSSMNELTVQQDSSLRDGPMCRKCSINRQATGRSLEAELDNVH